MMLRISCYIACLTAVSSSRLIASVFENSSSSRLIASVVETRLLTLENASDLELDTIAQKSELSVSPVRMALGFMLIFGQGTLADKMKASAEVETTLSYPITFEEGGATYGPIGRQDAVKLARAVMYDFAGAVLDAAAEANPIASVAKKGNDAITVLKKAQKGDSKGAAITVADASLSAASEVLGDAGKLGWSAFAGTVNVDVGDSISEAALNQAGKIAELVADNLQMIGTAADAAAKNIRIDALARVLNGGGTFLQAVPGGALPKVALKLTGPAIRFAKILATDPSLLGTVWNEDVKAGADGVGKAAKWTSDFLSGVRAHQRSLKDQAGLSDLGDLMAAL